MTEPELDSVDAALAGLPADWTTEDFRAAVRKRGAALAVARKGGVLLRAAKRRVEATMALIVAGDSSDETLAALIGEGAALASVAAACSVLPKPLLDPRSADLALTRAATAIAQAAPARPPEPSWTTEMSRWRRHRDQTPSARPDAPIPTDQDREAEAAWRLVAAKVDAWQGGVASWRMIRGGGASFDVLAMLSSAVDYIAQADALEPAIAQTNGITWAADAARRAAGLNWAA